MNMKSAQPKSEKSKRSNRLKGSTKVVKSSKTTISKKKPVVKKTAEKIIKSSNRKTTVSLASQKKKNSTSSNKVVMKHVKDFVYSFNYAGRASLYVVGTAHVSKTSVELVKEVLNREKPDVVYLELDSERKKALTTDRFREVNILKIIKEQKVFFFLAYLLLGLVQKKIAEKYGTHPGGEFLAALEWANQHQKDVVLVDREAQITVKRTWRSMTFWQQIKFIFNGLSSSELEAEFDVEKMQENDLLSDLITKLGERFPMIKRILIDERDEYMSSNILSHILADQNENAKSSKKITGVAVVGAGHLPGMKEHLKSKKIHPKLRALEKIPPPHRFWSFLPWAISGVVLAVFVMGFFYTDWRTLRDAFVTWSLITGGLSSLGALLAGAHPLVILIAFLGAPITTLHPVLGVGVFTAIAQFYLTPPKVQDFSEFSLKIGNFTFWWKNRITRIFLVFIFSSLGAAVGMWIALSQMINIFS